MKLIADSGSTKTDWCLVKEDKEVVEFSTIGFNPYFIKGSGIVKELLQSPLCEFQQEITEVFFYGAGCSSVVNQELIEAALASFFIKAKINVKHDMLAAAKSTCGEEGGLVAILGTGSNSCFYDGKKITKNIPALGYVLGDYGSGADIGKVFIKAYLEQELPKEIVTDFKLNHQFSTAQILDKIYKEKLPNRFLASFNPFISKHINHPFIKEIVTARLLLFFEKNILKYDDYQRYPLHLVGSIAFVYQDIIKTIAKQYLITLGSINKQPIDGLVNYHL